MALFLPSIILAGLLCGCGVNPDPSDAGRRIRLFDGKTFAGGEGNRVYFRIEEGAIVGSSLYEESRRRKILAQPDSPLLKQIHKAMEWTNYVIRCEGDQSIFGVKINQDFHSFY